LPYLCLYYIDTPKGQILANYFKIFKEKRGGVSLQNRSVLFLAAFCGGDGTNTLIARLDRAIQTLTK